MSGRDSDAAAPAGALRDGRRSTGLAAHLRSHYGPVMAAELAWKPTPMNSRRDHLMDPGG